MTNYETAKELFEIAKRLDKILSERTVDSDNLEYGNATMNLTEARDKIKRIAGETAQDESVEQEQDLRDDKEADSLEEDVNN